MKARAFCLLGLVAALGAVGIGCNDTLPANGASSTGGGTTVGSGGHDAATTGTGGATNVERGPKSLPLTTSPNGIFWDPVSTTLLIADDDGNRLLTWTDAGGFGTAINLAASPPLGLGGVVKMKDGTILVARFGFGTAGDIAYVMPNGTTGKIPNLDVTKRRIGLAVTDDGRIFDTYFEAVPTGYAGAVAEVKLSGSETDIVPTLQKPVGIAVVGSTLFYDDQSTNQMFDAPLASPKQVKVFATVPSPDLMCAGPNGTVFTGGGANARQISPSGQVTDVSTGFQGVRGVAYDAVNKRLFIADHDGQAIGIQPID